MHPLKLFLATTALAQITTKSQQIPVARDKCYGEGEPKWEDISGGKEFYEVVGNP
jgi:hypothetical protein